MLTPDKIRYENGVKICEKLIPDSARATKYVASYVKKGDPMKPMKFMSPIGITLHNTDDLKKVNDDAEQYTRATWPNCNMGGPVVHYYVDDEGAWQNLRENESGWHASDSNGNGNRKTIAIECIMDGSGSKEDLKARDNAARLIASIMHRYSWNINNLYTHNHWMKLPDKIVKGAAKNCPKYILPKYDEFKKLVEGYLKELKSPSKVEKPKVTVTGKPSTGTDEDNKKIWTFLLSKIGNEFGVAGLMGNLKAESSLRSNNLQQAYETRLGYSDDSYTKGVDSGEYKNFVKDSAGYGLAQWTYHTRKQNLLNYAKSKKKSISDLSLQLEFLVKELSESYKKVWDGLKKAKSVREASDLVLTKYEVPANQSEDVKRIRESYGLTFYNKFRTKSTIAEGDSVKIKEGATYGGLSSVRGKKVPKSVCGKYFKVAGVAKHLGVDEARLAGINSWVPFEYLYK